MISAEFLWENVLLGEKLPIYAKNLERPLYEISMYARENSSKIKHIVKMRPILFRPIFK